MTAAVTHHAAMGYHGAGTGLMPSERQRLTEWAGQALAAALHACRRPVHGQAREGHSEGAAQDATCQCPGEDGTPEDRREDRRGGNTKNAEIDVTNARLRREHLARATGGDRVLRCHLLYQTGRSATR